MVRLKDGGGPNKKDPLADFNSTMVRLKVLKKVENVKVRSAISIPLWYD